MTRGGAFVGIDLGTTYSLVARLEDGAPRIVPNALGELLTPSAVCVTEDRRILVGSAARARAVTHPDRTALCFKRDMGTDRVYRLGSRNFRPEELSALVLKTLRENAEVELGMPIAEAVVTVPAYFGELQRRATKDACELAGLPVERIINEPTAAALAYGLHQREREFSAVVLDLGGGTFDVTVLEVMEGVIEIQSTAGDSRLGGEDFVDLLVLECCRRVSEEYGFDPNQAPLDRARLREAVEMAKRRLSSSPRVRLPLVDFGPRHTDLELELDVGQAEQVWEPLLERIRAPIRRALRDAGAKPDSVDEVLLVGGATRMPCISRLAAQLFGKLPLRSLPADEAVALGAAVQVALKRGDAAVADMVVTDVAPFTLGIAVGESIGSHRVTGLFAPILERGTVLPASRVKAFQTMASGQTTLRVEVYQGEHSLCRDNQKLGEYLLKGIPPAPAGKESVEVRFTYDMNGILEVDMTVPSTQKNHSLSIVRAPGRLSEREISQIKKRLETLKFHPRDSLPNVTALARAERLFVELSGASRDALGEALTHFRAVLETQDPARIDASREALLALIAELRVG